MGSWPYELIEIAQRRCCLGSTPSRVSFGRSTPWTVYYGWPTSLALSLRRRFVHRYHRSWIHRSSVTIARRYRSLMSWQQTAGHPCSVLGRAAYLVVIDEMTKWMGTLDPCGITTRLLVRLL